eukprot:scaffold16288_cov51-Phaeocystis_antarctica.AAC.2
MAECVRNASKDRDAGAQTAKLSVHACGFILEYSLKVGPVGTSCPYFGLRRLEAERLRAVHLLLAAARAEEEREGDAPPLEAGLGAAGQRHVVEVGVEDGHAVGRVLDLVVPRCAALRAHLRVGGRAAIDVHAAHVPGARGRGRGRRCLVEPHATARLLPLGSLDQPQGDADCALVRVYGELALPPQGGGARREVGTLATHRLCRDGSLRLLHAVVH